MAPPTDVSVRNRDGLGELSEVHVLRLQVNNLTASLRLLTAKLDADAGVTDEDYDELITDTAIATAPALVQVIT